MSLRNLVQSMVVLVLIAGCNKPAPTAGSSTNDGSASVATAPTTPNPGVTPPTTAEKPAAVAPAPEANKLVPLDLSSVGVLATIDAPVGAKAKWSGSEIRVSDEKEFNLELRPGRDTLADARKHHRENQAFKLKTVIEDTVDSYIVEIESPHPTPFAFYINVKCGDDIYFCTPSGGLKTPEDLRRHLESARSIRQTDFQKKSASEFKAAIEKIERNGRVRVDEGNYSAFLGGQSDNDAVLAVQKIPRLISFEIKLNEAGQVAPDALKSLVSAAELREVTLRGPGITDAHLAFLKSLKGLKKVVIVQASVTGSGLANLADLPALEVLDLVKLESEKVDLKHLAPLTRLKGLSLEGSKFPDSELVHLEGMTSLRTLDLIDSTVSDAGLARLKKLVGLENLYLKNSKITDAGLIHLKDLKKLSSLGLRRTAITDAGLVHLKEFAALRDVNLIDTDVTQKGVDDLKAARKNLSVSFP